MSEIRKLREAVYDLATGEDEILTDEQWYDKLRELLDPVVDARAERQLAAARAVMPDWTSDDDDDIPTHDAGEYRDPNTGEVSAEAHRFTFEGSTGMLAKHLMDEHGLTLNNVNRWAAGLTQGDWTALDDLHRAAHETPTYKNWGVAWFSKSGESGVCARCQQARRVYQGYNGGAHIGKFCVECQGAVLRNQA